MNLNILQQIPAYDQAKLEREYEHIMKDFHYKIIVLDDDPTGIQKVHGIHVYTNWDEESILDGFQSEQNMFFILTNSRAFSEAKTVEVHEAITNRVKKISEQLNIPFLIISRGDSTLRGHYPLETATINRVLGGKMDGELLIPFFKEGGRYTIENIHYVKMNDELVPSGETEFAKDRTFGYKSSHLGEYIEEKTKGEFKKDSITYISLDDLRAFNLEKITDQLMKVENFNKVVVNAISDDDLKVLSIALIKAIQAGKQFLFRTAASFTKIIGHIPDKGLLSKDDMIISDSTGAGLIIVGSHVNKTTQQLNELFTLDFVKQIEFNSDLVLDDEKFEAEINAKIKELEESIANGQTTVIYTKRKRLDLGEGMREKELALSVKISNGLTRIIQSLQSRPKYVIAKGGITSSEIGTTALGVKKALVLGQALPGIPVWQTDQGCKYPSMPYIIFPGNVGEVSDLKTIVSILK